MFYVFVIHAPGCDMERKLLFSKILLREHHTSSPKVLTEIMLRFNLRDVYRQLNNFKSINLGKQKCLRL